MRITHSFRTKQERDATGLRPLSSSQRTIYQGRIPYPKDGWMYGLPRRRENLPHAGHKRGLLTSEAWLTGQVQNRFCVSLRTLPLCANATSLEERKSNLRKGDGRHPSVGWMTDGHSVPRRCHTFLERRQETKWIGRPHINSHKWRWNEFETENGFFPDKMDYLGQRSFQVSWTWSQRRRQKKGQSFPTCVSKLRSF